MYNNNFNGLQKPMEANNNLIMIFLVNALIKQYKIMI